MTVTYLQPAALLGRVQDNNPLAIVCCALNFLLITGYLLAIMEHDNLAETLISHCALSLNAAFYHPPRPLLAARANIAW